ncbi:MAG TPA: PAS domain S-box protein, partial [Labilithrix sp.]|nr:PAS domain S-box protein [Labilithrix sp.]
MSQGATIADLERRNEELARQVATLQAASTPNLLAAQAKLQQSQHVLRSVFDGVLDAITLADDAGRLVDANPAACELFGLPQEQVLGRSLVELLSSEHVPPERWESFLREGRRRSHLELPRADGTARSLDTAGVANIVPGIHLVVFRDVTELAARDHALRETRYLLEEAEAIAEIGCWVWEVGSKVFVGTRELHRIAGAPEGELIAIDGFIDTLVHPGDREAVRKAFTDSVVARVPFQTELRLLRPDGDVRWIHARTVVHDAADGRPQRVIGTLQDITERRRAAAELLAIEERHRLILETTTEGIWLCDATLHITFVNRPMADMLGYRPGDMVGRPVLGFVTDEARALASTKFGQRWHGEAGADRYVSSYRRKDGSVLWVLAKTNVIHDAEGRYAGTVGMLTDVTEQREAEEARDRLASVVESSGEAILGATLDGTITSWNGAAERLFGYAAAEMIGRRTAMLRPAGTEQEEAVTFERVATGERYERETVRQRKDGTLVEVSLLVSPIRGADGRVIGVSKFAREITARRTQEAALRRSEERLRQAQKMEAIG